MSWRLADCQLVSMQRFIVFVVKVVICMSNHFVVAVLTWVCQVNACYEITLLVKLITLMTRNYIQNWHNNHIRCECVSYAGKCIKSCRTFAYAVICLFCNESPEPKHTMVPFVHDDLSSNEFPLPYGAVCKICTYKLLDISHKETIRFSVFWL